VVLLLEAKSILKILILDNRKRSVMPVLQKKPSANNMIFLLFNLLVLLITQI
jgi:hypothetical protein